MIKICPYNPLAGIKPAGPKVVKPTHPDGSLASDYVKRIEESIEEYIEDLDDNEGLSVVVILNDGTRILVDFFGWYDPYMIRVKGFDENGSMVYALINQADLQVLITVVELNSEDQQQKVKFEQDYHQ